MLSAKKVRFRKTLSLGVAALLCTCLPCLAAGRQVDKISEARWVISKRGSTLVGSEAKVQANAFKTAATVCLILGYSHMRLIGSTSSGVGYNALVGAATGPEASLIVEYLRESVAGAEECASLSDPSLTPALKLKVEKAEAKWARKRARHP